ncbi:MAG: carbohydrate binding family 9 domain-containing protein [Flammeovirgaceae bacterium]|nr:carbohydrate binding family 9 domain-containing protein [Flammeovirgaceae bacterium]
MLKYTTLILLVTALFYNQLSFAQKKNAAYRVHISKTSEKINIDGDLTESAWQEADVAKDFFMVLPMDTSLSLSKTEVRLCYDDNNMYLSVICFDDLPGRRTVESLRRDFSFGSNENFLLFMDPFDDQTNGFSFGANAAGAQWDGLMADGGSVNLSWDNKWYSQVKSDDTKWVFEASIPFKSIRYKKGITEWGINFSRLDLKRSEKSSWAPVPRQFPTASLAYTGTLVWDAPPPSAGSNISLIPYTLGGINKDFQNESNTENRFDVGLDAKVAVTSSLNLDLTVNPDFSQVEVDRQVTNLSRFELFFPERRQFFLENSDLFGNFGLDNLRPFFSRRIGLNSPMQFGARLSGKINRDWRIGVMNVQTGKVDSLGMPAHNYTVAAIQRQVFSRSNISLIYIDKEATNYNPNPADENPYSKYNRNLGLEYNLASANNIWTGKAIIHKNLRPDKKDNTYMHAMKLKYGARKLNLTWQHEYVGENYNPEVGYVPRKNYIRINPEGGYLFFPKSSEKVISHGPLVYNSTYFNHQFEKNEWETSIGYGVDFLNRSSVDAWASDIYIKLLAPFDPSNSGNDSLPTGSEYYWKEAGFQYQSKPNSLLTYEFSTIFGGYFNGKRFNTSLDFGYRFQPYVSLSTKIEYNKLSFDEGNNLIDLWLISPRLDFTFTNNIFLTTFVQYNNQRDNVNLNVRFQWRYKPASDFYVVYTDNYFPENFQVKSRALVLKFTYWWNL